MSNFVWKKYCKNHGHIQQKVPQNDLGNEVPVLGCFFLADVGGSILILRHPHFTRNHVVFVEDGNFYIRRKHHSQEKIVLWDPASVRCSGKGHQKKTRIEVNLFI